MAKKKKCLPCLVHGLGGKPFLVVTYGGRGPDLFQIVFGKDRQAALETALKKQYDAYVAEIEAYEEGKALSIEEWAEDEHRLVEITNDMICGGDK